MRRLLLPILLAMLAACQRTPGDASAVRAGDIELADAWVREAPAGSDTAGGFLTIRNTGATPDRLVSIASPALGDAQIHEMRMDQGVMRMRQLVDGIEIAPRQTLSLAPGSGYHLMLMRPRSPLAPGQPVSLRLTFQRAGSVDVVFPVLPMSTTEFGGDHAH